jgi:hypothetical protein
MYPICVADALNSRGHYISGMGTAQLNALRTAFQIMTNVDTAAESLSEAQTFCVKVVSFSSPLPKKWWLMVKHHLVRIFNFIYLHHMY